MGSLTIDLVVSTQRGFKLVKILIAEPVEKGRITKAVAAGSKKNHRASFFDGTAAVIEGLLCLDEVDVLGFTAAGNHRQIGGSGKRHAVQGAYQLTAGQMRLRQIAAEDSNDVFVRPQDGIEEKIRFDPLGGLQQITMDRVAVEHTGHGGRMFAPHFRWVEHGKMAGHAGLAAGYAGDQTLAATAEAGKIVKADGAGNNDPIRRHHPAIDLHRNAAIGYSQVDQLVGIVAIMIVNGNAPVEGAEDLAVLFCCLPAMNPQGDDNADVRIRGATAVELVDHKG